MGSDYQDETAWVRGAFRKHREVHLEVPPHRRMAGRIPTGATGNPVKTLKNPKTVIFRDFVIQPSGRIGDGARGVLKLLARIRRKRLGKNGSKSVDAQVRFWARDIARLVAMRNAAFTSKFNLNACELLKQREATGAQGAAAAGAGGQVGELAAGVAQLGVALQQAGGAGGA